MVDHMHDKNTINYRWIYKLCTVLCLIIITYNNHIAVWIQLGARVLHESSFLFCIISFHEVNRLFNFISSNLLLCNIFFSWKVGWEKPIININIILYTPKEWSTMTEFTMLFACCLCFLLCYSEKKRNSSCAFNKKKSCCFWLSTFFRAML